MTSQISIDNISIKNHQGNFSDPIDLEITFSNTAPLLHPIEWKIIYFGSASNQDCDQLLEQFEIPPVSQIQTMKFQLSCQPPNHSKIPRQELLAVTAIILTVSYKNQQFIRVGYYVHYQYVGDQLPELVPLLPASEVVKMTKRTILFDKPRVTKFNIKWNDSINSPSTDPHQHQHNHTDQKIISEEESEEKNGHEEKQSTVQEKQQRSNNFSDQAGVSEPIECE